MAVSMFCNVSPKGIPIWRFGHFTGHPNMAIRPFYKVSPRASIMAMRPFHKVLDLVPNLYPMPHTVLMDHPG